jgi:hypothetical protein
MSMINGLLHIKCKHCGYNTSHGTKHHAEWQKEGSNFKLPASHIFVKECASLSQVTNASIGTLPLAGTAPCPQPPSVGPTTAPTTTLSINKSKLESALSDFERNSTDPNASALSDVFRSMFLN